MRLCRVRPLVAATLLLRGSVCLVDAALEPQRSAKRVGHALNRAVGSAAADREAAGDRRSGRARARAGQRRGIRRSVSERHTVLLDAAADVSDVFACPGEHLAQSLETPVWQYDVRNWKQRGRPLRGLAQLTSHPRAAWACGQVRACRESLARARDPRDVRQHQRAPALAPASLTHELVPAGQLADPALEVLPIRARGDPEEALDLDRLELERKTQLQAPRAVGAQARRGAP